MKDFKGGTRGKKRNYLPKRRGGPWEFQYLRRKRNSSDADKPEEITHLLYKGKGL